eukprot:g9175.t1
MPDSLGRDASIFGLVGQSLSDEMSLFMGDPLASLLSDVHESVGESELAFEINDNGLRTRETGLEAWIQWQEEQRERQLNQGSGIDPVTGLIPTVSTPSASSPASSTSLDVSTRVSSSDPPSSAVPTPSPQRIEAETMALSGDYEIADKSFASGDQLIRLPQKGDRGSAASTFTGSSGTYAVVVGYHDESDGTGSMSLGVGDTHIEWSLDQGDRSRRIDAKSFVRQVVSSAVDLEPGDVLRLSGVLDGKEQAAIDYIELIPVDPTVSLPFRVEAEDTSLEGYEALHDRSFASSGGLAKITDPSVQAGISRFAFPKQRGYYDVVVGYYDHKTGTSEYTLSVGGQDYQWLGDKTSGSNWGEGSLTRRTVVEGVLIDAGSVIELKGLQDQKDTARIDYIEFIPSHETSGTPGSGINLPGTGDDPFSVVTPPPSLSLPPVSLGSTSESGEIASLKSHGHKLWTVEGRGGGTTTYEFAIGPNGAQSDLHEQGEHVWQNGESVAWSLERQGTDVLFNIAGETLRYPVSDPSTLNALSLLTKVNSSGGKVSTDTTMSLSVETVNGEALPSALSLESVGPEGSQDLDEVFVTSDGEIARLSGVVQLSWPEEGVNPHTKNSQSRVTFQLSGYSAQLSQAPTGIALNGNQVAENSASGTVIGQLSTDDPDTDESHSYRLLDDASGRFAINGAQLVVQGDGLLDYETDTTHTIEVESRDPSGQSVTETFTVAVTNVNEAPEFTSTPVEEGNGGESYTYDITASDPDEGDLLTVTSGPLPDGLTLIDNGDGSARLGGVTSGGLHDIDLRVEDAGGLSDTQSFTLRMNHELVVFWTGSLDPSFDTTDPDQINDAVEVAIVDEHGNPVVHTLSPEQTASLNWTEGEAIALAPGVSYDASTQQVDVNLVGVEAGTEIDVVFRLVNNDRDTTTAVAVNSIEMVAAPVGTVAPVSSGSVTPFRAESEAPNFEVLEDVSASISAVYGQTNFNEQTNRLYAGVQLQNDGSYGTEGALLVVVDQLSDLSVGVVEPDGYTPEGQPYFEFTDLANGGQLNPGDLTQQRELVFTNPNNVQFSYQLVVLSGINDAPMITSDAVLEVIGGQSYHYDVSASDPDGDVLSYQLIAAPDGMTIDGVTGEIEWETTQETIGNHSVLVEVSDELGQTDTQAFVVSVIEASPNRPPIITSTPVVDATVATDDPTYYYEVIATDADNDELIYALVNAPDGMLINPETGKIQWAPSAEQLGIHDVVVEVTDGRGGITQQPYQILVRPDPTNHAPIIVSEPNTSVLLSPLSDIQHPGLVYGVKTPAQSANISFAPTRLFSFDGIQANQLDDLGWITHNDQYLDVSGIALSSEFGLLGFSILHSDILTDPPPSGQIPAHRGSTEVEGSQLIRIDPDTAQATVLAGMMDERNIRGAAFDRLGKLWAVDVPLADATTTASSWLLEIDPVTGEIKQEIELFLDGSSIKINERTDIAFHNNGDIYISSLFDLYTLDITTGELTNQYTDPDNYNLQGLAFSLSANSNQLIGFDSNNWDDEVFFYEINDDFSKTVTNDHVLSSFNGGSLDLASIPLPVATYEYDVEAIDPDSDPIEYTLLDGPDGMTIDSTTGEIEWLATEDNFGTHDVAVQVTDGRGGSDTQAFTVDVTSLGSIEGTVTINPDLIAADSRADFSTIQGENNWYYGYYNGPFDSSDFVEMTEIAVNSLGEQFWRIDSSILTKLYEYGGHASATQPNGPPLRENQWAVRRWISEVEGNVIIEGRLADLHGLSGNNGNGVAGHIFVDGKEVWSGSVENADFDGINYSINVSLEKGSVVDFAIDSLGNDWSDTTLFTSTIFTDDVGVANIPVYLDLNNDGILNLDEPIQLTQEDNPETLKDESGFYNFTDLSPNTYIVRQVIPDTLQQLDPINQHTVEVGVGEHVTDIDFINQGSITSGTVTGTVYESSYSQSVDLLSVDATLTADNHYSLYYGDVDGSDLSFVGRNEASFSGSPGQYNWSLPEEYTFNVDPDQHLYIVTWNDEGARMWLGEFNLPDGTQLLSSDEDWEAMVSDGTNPGRTGDAPPILELTEDIETGNWTSIQQSAAHNGQGWGIIPDISLEAEFVSYDSLFSSSPTDQNYVIYRTKLPLSSYIAAQNLVGLADQKVYVDINNNGIHDNSEPHTFSDAQGAYSIDVLPGDYSIAQEAGEGYVQLLPDDDVYTVAVADGEIVSALDFVNIEGGEIDLLTNQAPEFTSEPVLETGVGDRYTYRAIAIDPDEQDLMYDAALKPVGMVVSSSGLMVWEPTPDQRGIHDVILRVQDPFGGLDLQAFQIEVEPGNNAPIFTSIPPSDSHYAVLNRPFSYQFTAIDLEDDPITFGLDASDDSATIDPITGRFSWTPTTESLSNAVEGVYPFSVSVSDDQGGTNRITFSLPLLTQPLENRSPSVTNTTPRTEIRYEQPYIHQFEAVDPDGDAITYTLVNAPVGMTLSPDGVLAWVPSVAQSGTHDVEVQIGDRNGGVTTVAWSVNVSHQSVNHAPVITSVPDTRTNLTKGFRYDAQGSDADGDTLLWSLDEAPDGMVVDALSGQVSWNPESHQIGTHTVQLRATDTFGLFSGQAFEVQVTGVNTPPSIVSEALTQATTTESYRYDVVAVDPDGDEVNFSLGARPDGMTIDADTGVIRWTPGTSQTGNHEVEILVQDAQGGLNRQIFNVEVGTEAINHAPSIDSTPVFRADVGSPYRYQVDATDPDLGDILFYQLIEAPAGMSIDSNGEIQWDTPVFGNHKVVVGVNDDQGLGAAQGFTLTVLNNNAPVIRSTANDVVNVGDTYQYDVVAVDPDNQSLTYRLDDASVARGMSIDELGRVRWTPTDDQVASDLPVTVTVTDELGATANQSFTVSVVSDDEAPLVSLNPSLNPLYLGQDITFYVRATDNIEVTNLQVLINGEAVALNNGQVTIENPPAGAIAATVIATDAAGNRTTESITVDVIDDSDVNAPVIELPTIDGVVSGPIDIIGTVSDEGDQVSYSLSVAPVGTDEFREVFSGDGSVKNGVLGTFDPTLLANDAYTMRLTATDGTNTVFADSQVNVGGDLKLGNFTLSFTDLEIPVSGIPISVTRTYDSLNASTTDDFGYGWRLEFRDTDLRTSVAPPSAEQELLGQVNGFKDGDKVYITLPGGKRTGFTFDAELHPEVEKAIRQGAPWPQSALFYVPKFTADDESGLTLTVDQHSLLRDSKTGKYRSPNGLNYNPQHYFFGSNYTLTTKSGIEYVIDGNSGDLLTATDTNGNQLTFSDDGILSDTGVQVTFKRDAQGRIKEVVGPEDVVVIYDYDANGDLVSVTDPEKYTTTFDYHDEYDHYLDEVIDPLKRSLAKSIYNDEGRLETIFDANGHPVTITYDPAHSTQVVRDANDNDTFYEYDSRGNVVQQVDPSGAKTFMRYEDPNDPFLVTKVIDDNGNEVDYTYDANGHLTSRTALHDPTNENPDVTYYRHNDRGQMTSIVLPTGSSFSQEYDDRGNLRFMKDGDGTVIQSYTYDSRGNVVTESDPFGTTTYDNPDTPGTANDFDAFGNPYWMQDANGEVTRMTYNDRGLLETMTDDEGTSTFTYDKRGRETWADYGGGIFVEYNYGHEGDWTSLDAPTIGHIERKFTDDGKLGGWLTPDGGELSFVYDKSGRLWKETTPDGRVTRYEYDDVNRTNRVIDESTGLVAETVYDNVGRVKTRTQIADEGTADEVRYQTSYTYYDDGRVKTMTDARQETWTYEYTRLTTTVIDPLGRRTTTVQTEDYLPDEVRYADGSTSSTEFLFDNNLLEGSDYPTRVVGQGGHDRVFTYDDVGRLESATDLDDNTFYYHYRPTEENTTELNAFVSKYDFAATDTGIDFFVENADGDTLLAYDYTDEGELGRVIYEDGSQRSFEYGAGDQIGGRQIETVTLPSGVEVDYGYTDDGQEDFRTYRYLDGTTETVDTEWTPDGRVQSITDNSGTTSYTYDPVTGVLESIEMSTGGSLSYGYDVFGRIDRVEARATEDADPTVTQYQYDGN